MDDLPYEGRRTAKVALPALREYHSRPMLRRAVILVALVALACAAAPNAARTPTIAPGVIVGGVYLGGLTSEPARARLAADFDRPIPVVYGSKHRTVTLHPLRARAPRRAAGTQAAPARPGAT